MKGKVAAQDTSKGNLNIVADMSSSIWRVFVVNIPLQSGFSRRLLCSTYFDAFEYMYFYKAWLRHLSLIGTYSLALPQESGIAIDP